MSQNTHGVDHYEGVRQAAFAKIWDDYIERYSSRFLVAWYYDLDPDGLCEKLLEELAHRLKGRSVREIGHALAPSAPAGWKDRERGPWIGALGSWAIRPLADEDRAHLVGIAHVLGLEAHARTWGVHL